MLLLILDLDYWEISDWLVTSRATASFFYSSSIFLKRVCVCIRFDYFANRVRKVATDYSKELLFNIGDKGDFSYILEVSANAF